MAVNLLLCSEELDCATFGKENIAQSWFISFLDSMALESKKDTQQKFFLRIAVSLLTLLICSSTLSTLSIRALSIVIVVVLNSWPDDSSVSSVSGSNVCSALFKLWFLPFGMPCNFFFFFLSAGYDLPGKRTAVNSVVVRYGGEGAFWNPMIRSQSLSESVPPDCELHKCC